MTDGRRPKWAVALATLAIVAGIVGISIVGTSLPHRNDTGAVSEPITTTTNPTTTIQTTTTSTAAPTHGVGLAPGWEDVGTLPFEYAGSVVADTGSEVIVINGGRSFSTLPACGDECEWIGVAIDHETGAIRDLPPSPMCNAGTPAGIWAGDTLIVWSSTPIDASCPPAAAYSPATDQWWVLNSDIFHELDESAVVWTGRELVSVDGLAYNPVTGETRNVVAIDQSPMFVADVTTSQLPQVHWDGSGLLILGSQGMGIVDSEFTDVTAGPDPPLTIPWGWTSVWTGRRLLVVDGDSEAAAFDPSSGRWDVVDAAPVVAYALGPGRWTQGAGLAFLEAASEPHGVAVWDGTGEWKLLVPPELAAAGSSSLVASDGYLYQVGGEIYRYRIPELVDGVFPQPSFVPVGQQYLQVPSDWQVTRMYGNSDVAAMGRETITVELETTDGVGCKVEATSTGMGWYVPAFTQATTLVRDRDQVEIPVGETQSARDGLAHVVMRAENELVDVACPDLDSARLLAAHIWSPGTPPSQLPPGVEGDATCYVATQIEAVPAKASTEIIVQLELLNPEPCDVQGPLAIRLVTSDLALVRSGDPPSVAFSTTLTPDEPYLVATYTLSNVCSDPLFAIVTLQNEYRGLHQNVTAPCLDQGQSPATEFDGWEGPLATLTLQP